MATINTAYLSELPILTEKGNYFFLNEIISDGQYMQVGWLQVSRKNECIALYGKNPIVPIADENADQNTIIGA